MVISYINKKSVTLVELIIVIVLISIIGATVGGVINFFVQLYLYSPRQLDTQKIALETSHAIIEGAPSTRGARFARSIIDASDVQFSYTYGYPTANDQLSVRFRWEATDSHIYRSTSSDGGSIWSSEEEIPYYISSNIAIDGKDTPGVIFSYKKDNDQDWVSGVDSLADIRRLVISINVKTGAGAFGAQQGAIDLTSSVEIKGF